MHRHLGDDGERRLADGRATPSSPSGLAALRHDDPRQTTSSSRRCERVTDTRRSSRDEGTLAGRGHRRAASPDDLGHASLQRASARDLGRDALGLRRPTTSLGRARRAHAVEEAVDSCCHGAGRPSAATPERCSQYLLLIMRAQPDAVTRRRRRASLLRLQAPPVHLGRRASLRDARAPASVPSRSTAAVRLPSRPGQAALSSPLLPRLRAGVPSRSG